IVGVGRERNGGGIGQAEDGRDAALRARDELAEDHLPFVVGEARGIGDRAAVGVARRVRPKMMAVGPEMNAPRLRPPQLRQMRPGCAARNSVKCPRRSSVITRPALPRTYSPWRPRARAAAWAAASAE